MDNQNFRDLDNKVALITGAQRGVGLATAIRLARGGAKVVMADLPNVDIASAAATVAQHGEVSHHGVDIADEASVKDLIAFTLDTYGRLDILDNNAARQGLREDVDVLSMEQAVWDSVFAVNARGTMLMCKHGIAAMSQSGGGSIINISSGTALAGNLYQTAYACTKGAINTLTKYIATQYASVGIRCNALALGLIETEKLKESLPQEMRDLYTSYKLIPRLGKPEDIAEMVAFLGSDRTPWITGQIYGVDGGFFAKAPQVTGEVKMMQDMQLSVGGE